MSGDFVHLKSCNMYSTCTFLQNSKIPIAFISNSFIIHVFIQMRGCVGLVVKYFGNG